MKRRAVVLMMEPLKIVWRQHCQMCNILPRDGQSDGRRFTALFCWCRRNHPQESNCWREGWPAGCVCQMSVRMWSMQVPSGARAAGSPRPLNQRPDPYVDITGADEKIPRNGSTNWQSGQQRTISTRRAMKGRWRRNSAADAFRQMALERPTGSCGLPGNYLDSTVDQSVTNHFGQLLLVSGWHLLQGCSTKRAMDDGELGPLPVLAQLQSDIFPISSRTDIGWPVCITN